MTLAYRYVLYVIDTEPEALVGYTQLLEWVKAFSAWLVIDKTRMHDTAWRDAYRSLSDRYAHPIRGQFVNFVTKDQRRVARWELVERTRERMGVR